MCSQFGINISSIELEEWMGFPISPAFELKREVFPGLNSFVLIHGEKGLKSKELSYGLNPSWAKTKFATYNARVETIFEKPTWKKAILYQRCLVPFNCFYESIYEKQFAGNVVKIGQDSNLPLIAAGVYDGSGFAIVTREPLKQIGEAGHDRSPIFLHRDSFANYLDPSLNGKADQIQSILQSQADDINFSIESVRQLKGHDKNQLKLF